jgi:hypothetical protein
MTPTQVNLVEMAALADISATSNSLTVTEECQPKLCCYAIDDMNSTDYNLERKCLALC